MGCFLTCFGPSKDKKRRKQRRKVQVQPGDQRAASAEPARYAPIHVQDNAAEPVSSDSESRDKSEEKSSRIARKKVTFDSHVRTYEHASTHDEVPDSAPLIGEGSEDREREKCNLAKPTVSQSSSEDVSYASSVGSYTPNYRYENCRESDDEDLGSDCDESDLEDDSDDELDDDGEDDFDSANENFDQIDRSRVNREIAEENPDHVQNSDRMNSNARDRSAFVHPVLNPIENLTQWKAAKAKGTLPIKHQNGKEESGFDQESRISFGNDPGLNRGSFGFKSKSVESSKSSSREVSVDASLSNWLVSSESTPIDKKSPNSICSTTPNSTCQGSSSPFKKEDKPILGALTVEELRQFSATNSPRKSPSRSPDEMPIIGTVGTYWNPSAGSANNSSSHSTSSFKGIPNTISKYQEDRKVNWHSSPFETRLERALIKGSADEACAV